MTQIDQSALNNRLLGGLSREDFAALAPHLERVDLPRRMVLTRAGQPCEHAWFLENGLASVIARLRTGDETEIALCGRDGMVEAGTILHAEHTPFDVFMQIGGDGWRTSAHVLTDLIETRPLMRRRLLRYVQTQMVQTAYSTLVNATHSVEERLGRWLLMSLDRMDGSLVPLTHEFLALMLAVRRPTVTVALHMLEGKGWIRSTRGLVAVIDRPGLEDFVGESYSVPANELRRLLDDRGLVSAASTVAAAPAGRAAPG